METDKREMLERVTARLAGVRGVRAVVLGGSYARGMQRPGSDLDVGIFYIEAEPFAIDDIRAVAAEISARGVPDVTGFYGWGAWVNGGAWVHTAAGKVDFLYRNLEQVRRVVAQAEAGTTELDYLQQPAFGYFSTGYLAELAIARPLFDPLGEVAALQARVAVYPPKLKERLTASALWLAEFTLIHAEGYARSGDAFTTAGALARAGFLTILALFAINEVYYLSDKSALREIAAFAKAPAGYGARLGAALGAVGSTPETLLAAVEQVRGLWGETVALTGGTYRPAFQMG